MTGTKGKGSTCAFLESILRQSGFKTGLFRYFLLFAILYSSSSNDIANLSKPLDNFLIILNMIIENHNY